MNILEKLAKSAENNHGLQLSPVHVKEIVTIMQGMQFQIANDQGRLEAQTRILTVCLNQVGGALDIPSTLFSEAERYIIDIEWDDEGDNIRASIRVADVDVPEVQEDNTAAPDSDSSDVPVSTNGAGGWPSDRERDLDEEGEG